MKILFLFFVAICFAACSNDKTAAPDSGPNTTNVQNVNGNQPDTSSGITLDNRTHSDTTGRDTVPR